MSEGLPIDDSMDEIVQEFLAESTEGLDQFDRDIVALESNPVSAEHLASAFRIFHTIKGTCGFLGFSTLERLTHGAENLLAKLRNGEIRLNTARTDVLLDVGDTIRSMLAIVERTGQDEGHDITDLVRRLEALQFGPEAGQAEPEPALAAAASGSAASGAPLPAVGTPRNGSPHAGSGSSQRPNRSAIAYDDPVMTPSPSASRSVRVDVDLLDVLMRQVGELVLARNEVIALTEPLDNLPLHQTVKRLSTIVTGLQEGVMKTRMQPLSHLWSKLPRIVRDLCTQFEKEVIVEMEGGQTELDRTVLEAVRDPFTHLVRNAVFHGAESPEERIRSGKPRACTLHFRAFHESGYVIIESSDDGRGVNNDKVGTKAVEMGLVPPERLARMSPREITDLIFSPGFSTAESVSSVSGRGVGMDVVRSNIEAIGGTVDVTSQLGRGTTFRFKIPLTLAIVPALLVETQGQRFAIPQPNLVEMLHIGTEASPGTVERIDQATVLRLRGHLLPLVRLDDVLGFPPHDDVRGNRSIVAILQADDLRFGLVFDKVFETQEIVVKPLDSLLSHIDPFAGATILGDGTVALILDVVGLSSTAGLREATEVLSAAGFADEETETEEDKSAFVILRVGDNRTVAIPVEQVARLESLTPDEVEKSGDTEVVQYRGSLMRLVHLEEVLGAVRRPDRPESALKVAVHESDRGPIGFVVSDFVDVLEDVVELTDVDAGYGLAGAVVLHGRVTDVLDLETALLWMRGQGIIADDN